MIRALSISKSFRNENGHIHNVLDSISLEVTNGSSKYILGQSGIGKTVLLKIIAGLLKSNSGTSSINSAKVSLLFQKNALFDSLTAFDNLDFVLRETTSLISKQRRSLIEVQLDKVGLLESINLFPIAMSGGMQKRLALARSLITEPEVLLVDEPTAGLDPITSKNISILLRNIQQSSKMTILGVSSDVHSIIHTADECCVLKKNLNGATLIDCGNIKQLLNRKNEYFNQFISGSLKGPLTDNSTDPLEIEHVD